MTTEPSSPVSAMTVKASAPSAWLLNGAITNALVSEYDKFVSA